MAIDSITFNTESSVPGGALGASAASPQLGAQGGGLRPLQPVRSGADWFDSVGGMTSPDIALPEFLNQLTGPALARVKQQREWDGFVAARNGKTMEEIEENRPWYSQIFGPSNYEIGAATYHTQARAAEMETQLLQQMPELRKLQPEEFSQELNSRMEAAMTGNSYADTILKKTFMERAGVLTDVYTKERIGWQQAELLRAQVTASSAASGAYHEAMRASSRLGNAAPNQEQEGATVELQAALLSTLAPSQFQNDASYKQAVFATIRGAADRGEFYTVRAAMEAGIFGALDVDDAQNLMRYVEAADNRNRTRYAGNPEMIERLARLKTYEEQGIGGAPVVALYEAINQQYAADTGSFRPYFDADQIAAGAGSSMRNYIQERARLDREVASARAAADKEAAKAEAEARTASALAEAWVSGSWGRAKAMKHVTDEDADRAGAMAFDTVMQNHGPDAAVGTLVNNYNGINGKRNQMLADRFQHAFGLTITDQITDGFREQYALWKKVRDTPGYRIENGVASKTDTAAGPATATEYWGEYDAKLREYNSLIEANVPEEVAYRKLFGEQSQLLQGGDIRGVDAKQTKEHQKLLEKFLDDVDGNIYTQVFGHQRALHPSTAQQLAVAASYFFERQDPGMRPEDRARFSVKAAQAAGFEVAGRFGWVNGSGQQSLAAYLRDNGELAGLAFDAALAKAARKVGANLDAGSVIVNRVPDENGVPKLFVQIWDEDGVKPVVLTGEQVKAEYLKQAEKMNEVIPQGYVRDPRTGEIVLKTVAFPR